jgi:hypothetical protein
VRLKSILEGGGMLAKLMSRGRTFQAEGAAVQRSQEGSVYGKEPSSSRRNEGGKEAMEVASKMAESFVGYQKDCRFTLSQIRSH